MAVKLLMIDFVFSAEVPTNDPGLKELTADNMFEISHCILILNAKSHIQLANYSNKDVYCFARPKLNCTRLILVALIY